MKTKKLTFMSLLLALALVIYVVELRLPSPVPIPGAKLGLANIITLAALVWLGRGEAFTILVLRIILGSVFSGRTVSFIYSLSGGLLCFAVMAVMLRLLGERRLWVVSVLGAIAHNIGQISAAAAIAGNAGIWAYLPVLLIAGVVTGAFTGLCAQFTIKHMRSIGDGFLK